MLATVEQQNEGTRARAVGARAAGYEVEWIRTLRRRGIEPKRGAIGYKTPSRKPLTTLKDMARAWDIAIVSGRGQYAPVPELDEWAEAHGFNYVEAVKDRLPKAALAKADRRRRWL